MSYKPAAAAGVYIFMSQLSVFLYSWQVRALASETARLTARAREAAAAAAAGGGGGGRGGGGVAAPEIDW
jgi:hypothetical protein